MRYLLVFVPFIVFVACNSTRGDDRDEVRKVVSQMNDFLYKGNYEKVYDISYPNSYGPYTKEEVLNDLKNSIYNEEYDFHLNHIYVDSISEVYTYHSDKYARVNHVADASFRFKLMPKEDSISLIRRFDENCNSQKNTLGEENVRCDSIQKIINIKAKDYSIIIYKNSDQKWYVLSSLGVKNVRNEIPQEIRFKLKF